MSILFTGYYGQLNTGDDAFNVISDWGAKKYWNQDCVKIFGRNLPRRLDNSELNNFPSTKKYFKGQEIVEIAAGGVTNSKVIFSGGSVFHTDTKGLTTNNILKKYQKLGLIELGAIGVSLGPFKTKNDYNSIKDFLKGFSFLALRDKRSYDEALDMKLSIPLVEAFDLAALLPKIYPVIKTINKIPILGVSICNYERFVNGNLVKEKFRYQKILGSIKLLLQTIPDLKIKLLVFNSHPVFGDINISNLLIDNLPEKTDIEKIDYHPNTYNMWKEVSSCDAVLATRLHAGMFACFSETPFLQIEYHKKCSDFLKDIEYPENLKIGDIDISEREVCEKILNLLNMEKTLLNDLVKLENKALLNFTSFENQFK